jgi:hypothetical protein
MRDDIHRVMLPNHKRTQVVWEIEPLVRDRVAAVEIGGLELRVSPLKGASKYRA